MTDVVDDMAKLLRDIGEDGPYDYIFNEAARRCELVADFVKAIESGEEEAKFAGMNLYKKLKQGS